MANILTTAERCARGEGHAFTWTAVGDVTRCCHGRIFEACRGLYGDRRWRRLTWSQYPIRYRRAVSALEREARAVRYDKKLED